MRSTEFVIPAFARLSDWYGLWSMEATALHALAALVNRTDMVRHMAAAGGRPVPSYLQLVPGRNGKSIAVAHLSGTMTKSAPSFGGTSTVQLRHDIRKAAADPNIQGILLKVDSPGGTTGGTSELAAEVKRARRSKPLWALADGLMASAAYWAASHADAIYATDPTAVVGSIGTYGAVVDSSQAAEKAGVKVHLITTGPLKGAGAIDGAPVTAEQVAHYQRLAETLQGFFDADVKAGRGMTPKQLETVRSGGVYTAGEAQGLKLIDGIKSFDQTLAALAAAR